MMMEIPSSLRIPRDLQGCWDRDYIKQSFREARNTDDPTRGITRYLQTECGLCIDCRIDLTSEGGHDCFLGLGLWNGPESVLNWHVLVGYEKPGGDNKQNDCVTEQSLHIAMGKAIENPNATEDRGRVTWLDGGDATDGGKVAEWLETDVDGGKDVLEEKWVGATEGHSVGSDVTIRKLNDGTLITLRQGTHFGEVLVDECGGTVFSMGRITQGTDKEIWETQISTDSARVGRHEEREFVNSGESL